MINKYDVVILVVIFKYLHIDDLLTLKCVCKYLNTQTCRYLADNFWRSSFLEDNIDNLKDNINNLQKRIKKLEVILQKANHYYCFNNERPDGYMMLVFVDNENIAKYYGIDLGLHNTVDILSYPFNHKEKLNARILIKKNQPQKNIDKIISILTEHKWRRVNLFKVKNYTDLISMAFGPPNVPRKYLYYNNNKK